MKFLIRVIFLLVFFFVSSKNVFASDWFEVNPSDSIHWDISDDQIIGITNHLVPAGFLLTNFIPTEDFSWQFNFIPKQGLDHNIVWGFMDEDNYYQLHFAGGSLWVSRFVDGQEILGRGISFGWSFDQNYLIRIIRKNRLLSVFVDGDELFNFHDWTYDQGSILGNWGFKIAPGATFPVESVFRNLSFLDPNILLLPINKIMQTDPLWSTEVYDSAGSWSDDPTISRWGCALTSMVMILQFHDFIELSNGEPITPSSLNNWLNNQDDGYVGNGLLNWLSITRLVRELSDLSEDEVNVLPKLELSIIRDDWDVSAEMLLRSGIPTIGQVPSHFVVINGFDESEDDFFILDPYYEKTKTSEYELVNSLRVFQPSFTDLSYILIVHDPGTNVVISDERNNLLASIYIEENINEMEKTALTFLQKPVEQKYFLEFENISNFVPQIYIYSADAEVDKYILESKKIIIDFKKNNSTLNNFFNWQHFLEKLNLFYEEKKISLIAKNRIEQRVFLLRESIDKKRHENNLKLLLDFYYIYSDEKSINELQEILNIILVSTSL